MEAYKKYCTGRSVRGTVEIDGETYTFRSGRAIAEDLTPDYLAGRISFKEFSERCDDSRLNGILYL